MAIAVVQEWREEETDRSTTNYDAITERLASEDPVDGLLMHSAGFFGHGFRIFEVWESEAQFERFLQDRLMPHVAEIVGGDATQPVTEVYELHAFVIP